MASTNLRLRLKVVDPAVEQWYANHSTFHEGDAGLDLFLPRDVWIPGKALGFKIEMGVASEMIQIKEFQILNRSYTLHPRSSIHQTPLRLSNATGIIDAGYRGQLTILVDNLLDQDFKVAAGTRLVQLCAPGLKEFTFELVPELSPSVRGSRGLGSTGH
jgi:dUTP pyrophosphatase